MLTILMAFIAIVGIPLTIVGLFVSVNEQIHLSRPKMILLIIGIVFLALCATSLLFLFIDKLSKNIEPTPIPVASEYILPVDPTPTPPSTPAPTPEPTPDPTPESTPEPAQPRYLNVQCQNDPSFTDFYIELTSPDGQQPSYYFSSDLPVRLPDVSGTYSILIFRLTGELLYGNSTYIHDFADGWDVYFSV